MGKIHPHPPLSPADACAIAYAIAFANATVPNYMGKLDKDSRRHNRRLQQQPDQGNNRPGRQIAAPDPKPDPGSRPAPPLTGREPANAKKPRPVPREGGRGTGLNADQAFRQ